MTEKQFYKDGINNYLIEGDNAAINPQNREPKRSQL
jgi:hypothetical protein